MLGGIVVERGQLLQIVNDLGGGFGPLCAVGVGERLRAPVGVVFVFGVVDLGHRLLGAGVGRFRQGGQHVRGFVEPAALLCRLREHLAQRGPEPQAVLGDYRQHRPMVERSIAWLTRGNRRLRYRGTVKNDAWLHHRTAALNLRRLLALGLSRTQGTWAIS